MGDPFSDEIINLGGRPGTPPKQASYCRRFEKCSVKVVEEEEKNGITTMAKMTDTETKTKDSDDQKARTKLTEKQLTDKEPRENHSESKQTETMEEKAPPTRVLMIPIIGAIAIHPIMTEEIQTPGETKTPAATELEENKQAPPTDEICSATTHLYLTKSK